MAGGCDLEVTDDILQMALAGNESAFATVYRALHPRLVRYASTLVGGDAEDVAAEAWVSITRDLHCFSGTWDGFRGWAATITRHRALDWLRARGRRPSIPVDEFTGSSEPVTYDTPESAALLANSTDEAVALIATLPKGQAEAVMLRVVVGLDVATTAELLGKHPDAIRVAAHRGLVKLAQKLEGAASHRARSTQTRIIDITDAALANEGDAARLLFEPNSPRSNASRSANAA